MFCWLLTFLEYHGLTDEIRNVINSLMSHVPGGSSGGNLALAVSIALKEERFQPRIRAQYILSAPLQVNM